MGAANSSDKANFVIEEKGMSLDEARETPWPILNQHPKTGQPMGKLLDVGLLTEKDLGYLARNGHRPTDRKAAKILLLQQLNNIEETSEVIEPPKIVSPKTWTYAELMQYRFTLLQGAIIGLLVGLTIAFEVHLFHEGAFRQIPTIHSSTQVIVLIVILIPSLLALLLFIKLFNRIGKKIDEQIENHRKGRIGEEQTTRVIQQALNKNWSVYLNLTLPEKKSADMDAVLVGPSGIWLLEVKNMDGQFRMLPPLKDGPTHRRNMDPLGDF